MRVERGDLGAPLSLDCALGVPGGHALPAVGLLLAAPIMKRGKKKIEEKITAKKLLISS